MVAIEFVKRADWWQAALGGVAAVFAGVAIGTGWAIKNFCSAEFLAVAGLVPLEGEAHYAACIGVTGLWAISTFISGAAGVGGWTYDSGSGSANSKRDVVDHSTILNGTTFKLHRDNVVYDEFDQLISAHSPEYGHKIWHVGKINNNTDHEGVPSVYTFSSSMPFGNVSAIGSSESIIDALQTHERCHQGGNCTSVHALKAKRDSDSGWASYTDWGTNRGYDQDYEDWNYGYLVPHDYALDLGDQLLSNVQPCDTDVRCYAMESKYCLSLGYSQTRTVDSVAVGEVYMDAFGGVDGECFNG